MLRASDNLGPSPFRNTRRQKAMLHASNNLGPSPFRNTQRQKASILALARAFDEDGQHANDHDSFLKSARPPVVTESHQKADIRDETTSNHAWIMARPPTNLSSKKTATKQVEPSNKVISKIGNDLGPSPFKGRYRQGPAVLAWCNGVSVDATEPIKVVPPDNAITLDESIITSDDAVTLEYLDDSDTSTEYFTPKGSTTSDKFDHPEDSGSVDKFSTPGARYRQGSAILAWCHGIPWDSSDFIEVMTPNHDAFLLDDSVISPDDAITLDDSVTFNNLFTPEGSTASDGISHPEDSSSIDEFFTLEEDFEIPVEVEQPINEHNDQSRNVIVPQLFLQTGLGRIPPEIRVMIWDYVLTPSSEVRFLDTSEGISPNRTCPAVLQVCRLMFQESQRVFYSVYPFHIIGAPVLYNFLKTLGPMLRKELRQLRIGGLIVKVPRFTEDELDDLVNERQLDADLREELALQTSPSLHPDIHAVAEYLMGCTRLKTIRLDFNVGEEFHCVFFLLDMYHIGEALIEFTDEFNWMVRPVPYDEYKAWLKVMWDQAYPSESTWGISNWGNERSILVELVDKPERKKHSWAERDEIVLT